VFGSIVTSRFHAVFSGDIARLPAEASHSLGAALQHAATLPGARGEAFATAAQHAYVQGFETALVIAAAAAVLASGLIAWLLRPNVEVPVEERAIELEAA
jgi:DHA2 family multidrug resistance protein-like MFS transporter